MARITVEDCLVRENNRFALVQLASKRTKQLLQGSHPLISEHRDNKSVVISLREIADGKVRFMTPDEAARIEEEVLAEPEVAAIRTGPSFEQNGGSHSAEGKGDGSSNGARISGGSQGDGETKGNSGDGDEDDGL